MRLFDGLRPPETLTASSIIDIIYARMEGSEAKRPPQESRSWSDFVDHVGLLVAEYRKTKEDLSGVHNRNKLVRASRTIVVRHGYSTEHGWKVDEKNTLRLEEKDDRFALTIGTNEGTERVDLTWVFGIPFANDSMVDKVTVFIPKKTEFDQGLEIEFLESILETHSFEGKIAEPPKKFWLPPATDIGGRLYPHDTHLYAHVQQALGMDHGSL